MSTVQTRTCPVCGSSDEDHRQQTAHHFTMVKMAEEEGHPLAFVIDVREAVNASSRAAHIARARSELKKYYPDLQFEILPSDFYIHNDGNFAEVRAYIAIQI